MFGRAGACDLRIRYNQISGPVVLRLNSEIKRFGRSKGRRRARAAPVSLGNFMAFWRAANDAPINLVFARAVGVYFSAKDEVGQYAIFIGQFNHFVRILREAARQTAVDLA